MTEMQQPPIGAPAPAGAGAPARGGGLAVAALVLGLLSLIPIIGLLLGLIAAILGIGALAVKTRRKSMAAVGVAFGVIGMVVTPVVFVSGAFWARGKAKQSICAANLNIIGKGLHIYLAEFDQVPPEIWTLTQYGTSPQAFKCPSASSGRRSDYFFLLPPMDVPGTTIIACDYRGNHKDGRNILTFQATVKWLSEADFQAELALPENAAFAKALRQAEGP